MTDTIKKSILEALAVNKGEWLTNRQICNIIYYSGVLGIQIKPIELRDMIKDLRFGGHQIIASSKGYKLAESEQELQEYIASRKLELESELNILRKMEGKW